MEAGAARLKMQAEPQTGPAAGVSRSTASLGRAGVAAVPSDLKLSIASLKIAAESEFEAS